MRALKKKVSSCLVVPSENRSSRAKTAKQRSRPAPARRERPSSFAVCCQSKTSPECTYPHCDVGWTEIAFSKWGDPIC